MMSEKPLTDFGSPGEMYVKKKIPIEAKQLPFAFSVKTIEGTMKGKPMDYLIKGVKGELYPCDKEIFETTYEEVDREDSVLCKNCGEKIRQIQKGIWVHLKLEDAQDCGKPKPMTEKVLGFKEDDSWADGESDGEIIKIERKKLVPVRLKSESVSLEWLKKHCKENHQSHTVDLPSDTWNFTKGYNKALDDLLSAAKGEKHLTIKTKESEKNGI